MQSIPKTSLLRAKPLAQLAAAVLLAALSTVTFGQAVYRIVGPDGKVTFSDRPPAAGKESGDGSKVTGSGTVNPPLPFELKQVASKFPVTLYTAPNCNPCASAKALLIQRGVPFSEKTVSSNDDLAALKALSGDTQLPFGTVGSQQLRGFNSQEWSQYLDAANYPAQSQLPRTFRNPDPSPLVAAVAKPATSAASSADTARPTASRPARAPAPAPVDTKSNPAGIRF